MNRWICWIVGIYRTLLTGKSVNGCDWVDEETNIPAFVTISRCEICKKLMVSWKQSYAVVSGETKE